MRLLCTAFVFFFLLFSHSYVHAQKVFHTSRVRIHLPHADIKKLRAAGVEFDHGYYNFEKGFFENEFAGEHVEIIKSLGYKYEVILEDVFRHLDSLNQVEDPRKYANDPVHVPSQYRNLRVNFTTTQNFEASIPDPPNFSLGSMGGFYNLAELTAELDEMLADPVYGSLISRITISGNTLEGRPMYAYRISDNAATDENEPEILYTGMHHSREGMSMMNLIFFMRFLLDNYDSNQAIKDLVNNRELYFVPVVNIDGFNYNTTASNWNASPTRRRMRRKNMRETTTLAINSDGSGGDGVDLNRNFPTYWGSTYSNGNTASSGSGNADAYRGPSAASEPETVNMMNFVNSRSFKVALNYHCAGNWWIRPEGPDQTLYPSVALPATAVNNYNSIAALFTKYNCYVYGTANQTIYDVNGYSDDWFFADPSHSPIYAFSPEIGNSSTDGFWCAQSRIIPLAKEMIFPNLQAAYTGGIYAELQDTSDVVVSGPANSTFSLGYTITRRGLTDGPITVTVLPLNNIQTVGGPVTISSIPSFGGQVSGSISYTLPAGTTAGTPIRFVWQLEMGGITIRDTVIKFYNPTEVFSDNMETPANFATKWVATSNVAANWSYESGTGLQGSASLTESNGGSYSINADQIVRLASPLNLTSSAQVYLSYMLRYGSENCLDRMQVEISTTGVNGTYVPIVTNHTIRENRGNLANQPAITGSSDGWVRELIDLSPYAGNNNIGLRFRFQSNGTNTPAYSTNGFQIDNLKVVKTNAYVLPLSFTDIIATRDNDIVTLRWKASTDATFSHYVVQRSSDGSHFETMASLSNPTAISYNDLTPSLGKNYYRIQLVSRTGEVINSRIVTVIFERQVLVQTYPNPFINELNVEIHSNENGKARIDISSIDGKQLYSQTVQQKKGLNLYKINTVTIPSQPCILVVRNSVGTILHSQRLYKSVK